MLGINQYARIIREQFGPTEVVCLFLVDKEGDNFPLIVEIRHL